MAAAALSLYRTHRGGDRPVVAVIYTHSHVDHFAGVRGVVDEADVRAGRVRRGDLVVFTARCQREGFVSIGFGSCAGRVLA